MYYTSAPLIYRNHQKINKRNADSTSMFSNLFSFLLTIFPNSQEKPISGIFYFNLTWIFSLFWNSDIFFSFKKKLRKNFFKWSEPFKFAYFHVFKLNIFTLRVQQYKSVSIWINTKYFWKNWKVNGNDKNYSSFLNL